MALSYRGYWRSRGRASEPGLILDAAAALSWVAARFPRDSLLVLWGQSLGAGVATAIAAAAAERKIDFALGAGEAASSGTVEDQTELLPIGGLVLETPFLSMRRMLASHYPQRWVPYRYLWPFLRSHWDSADALKRLGAAALPEKDGGAKRALTVMVLDAGKDEVVPAGNAKELVHVAREAGLDVRWSRVERALHNGVMATSEGRNDLATFVCDCAERGISDSPE